MKKLILFSILSVLFYSATASAMPPKAAAAGAPKATVGKLAAEERAPAPQKEVAEEAAAAWELVGLAERAPAPQEEVAEEAAAAWELVGLAERAPAPQEEVAAREREAVEACRKKRLEFKHFSKVVGLSKVVEQKRARSMQYLFAFGISLEEQSVEQRQEAEQLLARAAAPFSTFGSGPQSDPAEEREAVGGIEYSAHELYFVCDLEKTWQEQAAAGRDQKAEKARRQEELAAAGRERRLTEARRQAAAIVQDAETAEKVTAIILRAMERIRTIENEESNARRLVGRVVKAKTSAEKKGAEAAERAA